MSKLRVFYGDIHNHCNISYGKGSLTDAISNAKQKLDFVSVTGHAHWCDMPEPNERIKHIVDFHEVGFSKLRSNWKNTIDTINKYNEKEKFLVFPGFELHSSSDGDLTIVYFENKGDIIYTDSLSQLQNELLELRRSGIKVVAIPHHIGYKKGQRGINWDNFRDEISPVIEIYSMHGSAENTDEMYPYRHSMGPVDWHSSMQYGLASGKKFGFVASTDHHNAHPASFGQGYMGVWAEELTHKSIYNAINNRRTFALTGDKISIDYELDKDVMGSIKDNPKFRGLKAKVCANSAIDSLDIVMDNKLVKRISSYEILSQDNNNDTIISNIFLEVGWGHRGLKQNWDIEFGISEGEILDVEPRFRGPDILSPEQKDNQENSTSFYSKWDKVNSETVRFETITYGNPTNTTSGTQGVDLKVVTSRKAKVKTKINGIYKETPVSELLCGGKSGYLIDEIDSPSWLLHRMPLQNEFEWDIDLADFSGELEKYIYLRVRQINGQMAWASPIFAK